MNQARTSRGPGRPSRSENRDTRGQILLSAEKLFAQTGFTATSLRQIAVDANVDLATIKYHFGEKNHLYDEAFRIGHSKMVEHFSPLMVAIAAAENHDDLRDALTRVAQQITRFLANERNFVRLALFRILERADDMESITNRLQGELVELLAIGFERAKTSSIGRDLDIRAFVTFIISGLPMWLVAAESRQDMLGTPGLEDPEWDDRVENFVRDLLLRQMLSQFDE